MKQFDLEKAKNGAEVCLLDGTTVKILDFDFNGDLLLKVPYKEIPISTKKDKYFVSRYDKTGCPLSPFVYSTEFATLYMKPKVAYMKVYVNNSTGLLEGDTIDADFTKVKTDASAYIGKDFFCYAKVELLEQEGGEK